MDLKDEHALNIIKNVYGGSIKLRSGVQALRYRLHNKKGLTVLLNDLNGYFRNPTRIAQFNMICMQYNILIFFPEPLQRDDGWLAGFIDADGTITLNCTTSQIEICANQKNKLLLDPLIPLYGGNVYIDRSKYISFKWVISHPDDLLNLIDYFKLFPLRSAKKGRALLIPKLLKLKAIKAHLAPEASMLSKAWAKKASRFNNFNL